MSKTELHSAQDLARFLADPHRDWTQTVVQGVDLTAPEVDDQLRGEDLAHTIFLGCPMTNALALRATAQGALLFTSPDTLPFQPYRPQLYSAASLLDGYQAHRPGSYRTTTDWRSYLDAMDPVTHRRRGDLAIDGVLFQRLHDLSMQEALDNYLRERGKHEPGARVVGIMGGHDRRRVLADGAGDPSPYLQVARLGRSLSRRGFTVATGGGPGSMEAANLGAWMADRSDDELKDAIRILSQVPTIPRHPNPNGRADYDAGAWLAPALEVMATFPREGRRTESLGIPTWFYGHEPPNPFATHIAKFFDNSLREEGLLAIASGGVVFTEGNGGTVQEIFQDACQNYYGTYGHQAPMVLLGKRYWNRGAYPDPGRRDKPAWELLRQLGKEKGFADRLLLTDSIQDAAVFLARFHRPATPLLATDH